MDKVIDIVLTNRKFEDINPLFCGTEACEPSHKYGPAVRRYYLLHYVLSGEGVFEGQDGVWRVSAGEFFLIRPGEITTYTADEHEPWQYVWIAFDGRCAALLDDASPVGRLPRAIFSELHDALVQNFAEFGNGREFYLASLLHRIFAELHSARPSSPHYASRAKSYISAMYMQDISVESVADTLSLNRRYLSRLFRERYGVTMQEYIVSVRLEAAAKLLSDGYSVGESARLCGYRDQFNFSKMFRRRYGVSPKEYAYKAKE